MKILFTTSGGMGNFNPLVPLARALQSQAHQIAFATPARFCAVVAATGFEAIPAGLDLTFREYREQLGSLPADSNEVAEVFVKGLAGPMLTDLLQIIPEWRPDLLVHDGVEFAAPIAGELLNIPHVAHNLVLIGFSPKLWDFLIRQEYATFRQGNGLPPDPEYREYFRYMYVQHVPERITPLPPEIAACSQLIRPEFPAETDTELPAWSSHLSNLPTVYVTLGTVFNQTSMLIETILEALGSEDYNLVVTVGAERDPQEFGLQPPTVLVERYIPQAAILPKCDVVVCHGGSGTLLGALSYGKPMLIIPLSGDHFLSAERLSSLGVAEVLPAPDVTAQSVRAAVQRVISTSHYRERAMEIKDEITVMPSPDDVARVIEARWKEWSQHA